MSKTTTSTALPHVEASSVRLISVIELGTTSIRMVIAQRYKSGRFTILDTLQQAVSLGKDTFTGGAIGNATTESCVKALRSFRQILKEYRIDDAHIRAVATSAVREASNRDAFLDRILIATNLKVRVLDDAEVSRLTYLAVRPVLAQQRSFRNADTIVVEVGGGSTEALMFRKGKVGTSHMYRLGSLRLREMFDAYREPEERSGRIMQSQIDQTVEQIRSAISPTVRLHLVALGGDARFACTRLHPGHAETSLVEIGVKELDKLSSRIVRMTPDAIVHEYRLTYQEAETLGPALLVYARLAKALKLKTLLVGRATLRDGLLYEITTGGAWTAEFTRQILNSALEVAKRYHVDLRHAKYVAAYSRQLFRALRDEHGLGPRAEVILTTAALLHETGLYVGSSGHHKHSMYLILNSDLFGLGSKDILLTALVARYHRRATPGRTHTAYTSLPWEDRIVVSKLAAILRVANALDRGRSRRLLKLDITPEPGVLVIAAHGAGDLTLEQHRLREQSTMFEQIYGMKIELHSVEGRTSDDVR